MKPGRVANAKRITLQKLAHALDAKATDLLDGDEPTLFEEAAGGDRYIDSSPVDEVKGIALEDDQIFVAVKGRSMEPTLYDGDLEIVSATKIVENTRDIYLININGVMRQH